DATLDPQQLRPLLFETVRTLFARLSARGPVVLLVDDLQCTDADSLALLAELLRPPDAPKVLLLTTTRDPDIAAAPPRRVVPVRLGRLAPAEGRALAAALAASHAAAGEAIDLGMLAREAEGHPLFIEELVRHRLTRHDGVGPPRLDDALCARVDALDDDA